MKEKYECSHDEFPSTACLKKEYQASDDVITYINDKWILIISKKPSNMPPEEQKSIETIKWPVWFWLAVLAVGLLGLVIIIK